MTIHDRAHELTRAIKSSSEYLEYKRLKKEIESDAHLKDMIDDFHERQLTLQKQHLIDNQTDPVEEKKLHFYFHLELVLKRLNIYFLDLV